MYRSPEMTAVVPPGVVTRTSTTPPEAVAGAVAFTWVAETGVTAVPLKVPNVTAVAPVRLVPVMVTTVPPARGPAVGATEVTTGVRVYVNLSAVTTAVVPPGVVTHTSTGPAAAAGAVTFTWLAETLVRAVPAAAPNVTFDAFVRLVPVTVTTVPPARGPAFGVIDVTVGAAW